MSLHSLEKDSDVQFNLPYPVTPSLTSKGGPQTMVLERSCLCGTKECVGLSSAFRVLGRKDPRSYFHRVPRRMSKRHSAQDRAAIDAIRKAYITTLFPDETDRPKLKAGTDYFIAKHHFAPGLVMNYQKLPYTLPDNVLLEHKVNPEGMHPLRTLLAEPHPCEKSLMVVPNYPREQTKRDLQVLLYNEERSRLYQARQRLKKGNSSGSLGRLLRQNSSSSLGKPLTLTLDDEDDPTETTFGMDSFSTFTSPTADMDLWYEQSRRIALPPTPLVRPDLSDDENDDDDDFNENIISEVASGGKIRSSSPTMPDTSIFFSDEEVSRDELGNAPLSEMTFLLRRTDPQRPTTPASTEYLQDEIFKFLKCANVRRVSERKAATRKSEFRHLILHQHALTRRPNTGIFSINSVHKGLQKTEKRTSEEEYPSSASVLSTLTALASPNSEDETDSAYNRVRKQPDSVEDREEENSSDLVTTEARALIPNLDTFQTSVVRDSSRRMSCCTWDGNESDSSDNKTMLSCSRQSILELKSGYESEVSLTLPEALENTGKDVTPWHVQKLRSSNVRQAPPIIGRIASSYNMTDASSTPTTHSMDLSENNLDELLVESRDSDEAQLSDPVPASGLLAGVLGEDSLLSEWSTDEQNTVAAPERISEEDTSDSSTDSKKSVLSSGKPYSPTEITGTPDSVPPEVPSGVLVTVLETSHLNTLLGDDGDDDSDFEEKWEKANKRKDISGPSEPAPFSIPTHYRNHTHVTHSRMNKDRFEKMSPSLTENVRLVAATAPHLPKRETTFIRASLNGMPCRSGRNAHGSNRSVKTEGDKGESTISNAIDALENFVDDLGENKHEIDFLELKRDENDCDPSDVSSSSSSSESDESSEEVGSLPGSDRGYFSFFEEGGEQGRSCAYRDVFSPNDMGEVCEESSAKAEPSLVLDSNGEMANESRIAKLQFEEKKTDIFLSFPKEIPQVIAQSSTSVVSVSDEVKPEPTESQRDREDADTPSGSKKNVNATELDFSQSTRDASSDEDSEYSHFHSRNDILTVEDTTERSHAANDLSNPDEQEELAYLEMLTVEENERHEWFTTMQKTLDADYHVYVQILATMKYEVAQVYRLMDYSHQAIEIYTKSITVVLTDPVLIPPKGSENEMMNALINSYKILSSRFEESLPGLEASVQGMASYKSELNRSIQVIQNRGYSILQELSSSEDAVRRSWAVLEKSLLRLPDDSSSLQLKDRWLEEVNYRQAVASHVSLWRERTADLKDLTVSIFELERECHQRLKDILLEFLPKRHDIYVGVRDLLDPAVDVLETAAVLSEMGVIDTRLEQAVLYFQPEKKRSILSIVSSPSASYEKPPSVPSLCDFKSLAKVDNEMPEKVENVLSYSFVTRQEGDSWVSMMAVTTQQHFLHMYLLHADTPASLDGASADEVQAAVRFVLQNGTASDSIALISCDFEYHGERVVIRYENETPETERETTERVLNFWFKSQEEASQWLFVAKDVFDPVKVTVEHKQENNLELQVVRV